MAEIIVDTWKVGHSKIRKNLSAALGKLNAGDKLFIRTTDPAHQLRSGYGMRETKYYWNTSWDPEYSYIQINNAHSEEKYYAHQIFHGSGSKDWNYSAYEVVNGMKFRVSTPKPKKQIMHIAEWELEKPLTYISSMKAKIIPAGTMLNPYKTIEVEYSATVVTVSNKKTRRKRSIKVSWDGKRFIYKQGKTAGKPLKAQNEKEVIDSNSTLWEKHRNIITRARAVAQSKGDMQNPDSSLSTYYNLRIESMRSSGGKSVKAHYKNGAFWYKKPKYGYYYRNADGGKEVKVDACNEKQVLKELIALEELKIGARNTK
jgi:hypothetical protein